MGPCRWAPSRRCPVPGHTEGGLCFLHDSAHGRCLFSGDVLYVAGQALETLVVACDGGDANTLARTLRALKPLRPDWVFSSAFVGERSFMDVRGGVWDAEIARNLRRLEGD